MTKYVLQLTGEGIYFDKAADANPGSAYAELAFSLANVLDDNVQLQVSMKRIGLDNAFGDHSITLKFIDTSNDDVVYDVTGILSDDENDYSSIVAILAALDDFDEVSLTLADDEEIAIEYLSGETYYNDTNSLVTKFEPVLIPPGDVANFDLYDLVTMQDDLPTVLYMQLGDDLQLFTDMVRIANRLDVRLIVELPPSLTLEQAVAMSKDLGLDNHRITLLWSPILARPSNAVGLKGRKIGRYAGGVILAEELKRRANTNASGIPAIHRPIANYDYPINFVGIEQKPGLVLNDQALKTLANARINIVKRERFPNGIRFVINDCLTAYGDNRSVLKLTNASDIVMFIDNRLKEICKRHLLKDMDGTIADTEKECRRFLEACTSKERPLLRVSKELGGFFTLSVTPRDDRPDDAIDLEWAGRPQGAGRAIYLKSAVTK